MFGKDEWPSAVESTRKPYGIRDVLSREHWKQSHDKSPRRSGVAVLLSLYPCRIPIDNLHISFTRAVLPDAFLSSRPFYGRLHILGPELPSVVELYASAQSIFQGERIDQLLTDIGSDPVAETKFEKDTPPRLEPGQPSSNSKP